MILYIAFIRRSSGWRWMHLSWPWKNMELRFVLCRALHNIGVSNFLLRHETRSYGVLLLPKHCQKHIGPIHWVLELLLIQLQFHDHIISPKLNKIQKNSSISSGDCPLSVYKLQGTVKLNLDRCGHSNVWRKDFLKVIFCWNKNVLNRWLVIGNGFNIEIEFKRNKE